MADNPQVDQLSLQLTRANQRLRERIAGLTDEEYFWEPVPGAWSVRRREDAASPNPEGEGKWVLDSANEEPSPPPFTTIAWRLMHLAGVLWGYDDCLWNDGALVGTWPEMQPRADVAVAMWERQASTFADRLATETDASLQHPITIPWWPQPAPRWRVVANVIMDATHHGAEIALLRDLYRDQPR